MSIKQKLLEFDPHGFELARKKLEEVYPTLDYVATSSAGAAVGDFPPPYEVSPQQLTRAFLASRNFGGACDPRDNPQQEFEAETGGCGNLDDFDSLGKRIIQSQHTGIWRLACRSLVDFFNDPANAGRGNLARESANPAWSAPEHDSPYDRNLLLYVTIEAAMALEITDKEFTVDGVWRRMCDHGNYLVPTERDYYESYDAPKGTDVPSFLPILAYGSLELLRSTAWASGSVAPSLFPEDLARYVVNSGLGRSGVGQECDFKNVWVPGSFSFTEFGGRTELQYVCEHSQEDWLAKEETARLKFAPSVMQARYCDAELEMTVDEALGTPQKAPSFLYDIYKDERITQGRSGEQLSSGQGKTVSQGGVWMYAKAEHFEAEIVTDKYRELNLNALVYVTSSHDPDIPPGIHRLLDIAVFAGEESCRTVAFARCRTNSYGREETYTYRTRYHTHTVTEKVGQWFTTLEPAATYVPSTFVNGVELFVRSRYHSGIQEFPGSQNPNVDIFKGVHGCRTTESSLYLHYGGTEAKTGLDMHVLINRLRHPTPPQPPAPPRRRRRGRRRRRRRPTRRWPTCAPSCASASSRRKRRFARKSTGARSTNAATSCRLRSRSATSSRSCRRRRCRRSRRRACRRRWRRRRRHSTTASPTRSSPARRSAPCADPTPTIPPPRKRRSSTTASPTATARRLTPRRRRPSTPTSARAA